MHKFIYVFDRDGRDALCRMGYRILQADEKAQVYVFINDHTLRFAEKESFPYDYALSDTLVL